MKDTDKLNWLKHELHDGADLQAFAKKFLELFADRFDSDNQQAACLKLYRKYARIPDRADLTEKERSHLYSMRCRIPPPELLHF